MADASNKRQSDRRRTLFGGTVFDEDGKAWNCFISDVSEHGAKVKAKGAELEIGTFVDLKIHKFNDFRRCKVMWLREGYVGLEFVVKLDKTRDDVAAFFKLMEIH